MIEVSDLGKRYSLEALRSRTDTLRDHLGSRLRAGRPSDGGETIWALRHVSFEVLPGEVLGVIGPNGAGKSTLLKILARVTRPTEGSARVRGRAAALLEIGTGFNPELSGRENILLSGAILGMSRVEIERKFDAIVDFAETGPFLETPVKRYSSGMYVRLAFSVMAHMECNVLLVDEALAVGDAEFQRKCLSVMAAASREGRTLLVVSHDLSVVQTLCTRALLLDHGNIVVDGSVNDALERYASGMGGGAADILYFEDAPVLPAQLTCLRWRGDSSGGEGAVVCEYVVRQGGEDSVLSLEVRNAAEVVVLYTDDQDLAEPRKRAMGNHRAVARLPVHLLAPGEYLVSARLGNPGSSNAHEPSARLVFHRRDPGDGTRRFGPGGPGVLWAPTTWEYVEGATGIAQASSDRPKRI